MRVRGRVGALACLLVCGTLGLSGGARAQPRVVYLWFADGGPLPDTGVRQCAGATPPAYACSFGASRDDCRRAVQMWLDRWYADFNLVFTYRRPAGGPFDTIIVTHQAAWCGHDEGTTSRSPLPTCRVAPSGWVLAFQCAADAKRCASIIAQEQAHLVGLGHTTSEADVMNEAFPPNHDGFENADNTVTSNLCVRPQNSYKMMLARLGPWPGGAKPDPAAEGDPPPDAGVDGPAEADAAEGDAPGADAAVEVDAAPAVDGAPGADAATPAPGSSGCGCAIAGNEISTAGPLALLLALLVLGGARRRP